MKRITSLVLILILAVSIFALTAQPARADSQMKVSDKLIKVLKLEEGFIKYPTWDYGQYSIGYGTRCPSDMLDYYQENGITESEAELLLRNYLTNTERIVNTKLIDKEGLTLTQGQFDAVVSFSYNMGTAWIGNSSQNIYQKVVGGATGNDLIDAFARWCNAGGQVQGFLIRRRLSEANMFLNEVYSRTAPSNFCYVTYDANGGSATQKVQGYDADLTAKITATATYDNYTFDGWYTAQVGGTKVRTLKKEHNGTVLYARWKELEDVDPGESTDPISVQVTTDGVNLRKGPGTNYAAIGIADTGEKFDILQVRKSGGYTWGQYDGGWICLDYTNYDQVISGQNGNEPEPTEPPATQKPTEPETTAAPTEPKEDKVTGTVNADPYLCVREGPGTGYATVDTIYSGEKVTITKQKTVGSMIWGKISNGWVSMSYITLDKKEDNGTQNEQQSSGSSGQTGTVTCGVLNIRSGAGINYGIVGYYYKGDSVTVTKTKTVGSTTWGKTAKGWVSMEYISVKNQSSSGTASSEQNSASTTSTGTVTSSDVLRVRSGAGTSYSIVGFLDPGAKVTVTQTKTVGSTTWGKVSQGWISMDYVKLDSTSNNQGGNTSSTGTVKTVTASCLCVRSGAGTNNSIVGYLYSGARVTVTKTKKVDGVKWGKTSQGWICLEYTK